MGKSKSGTLVNNLIQLQNAAKRDPESYTDEVLRQIEVYKAQKNIFEQNPVAFNKTFYDLAIFFAQVSSHYMNYLNEFPEEIASLLRRHCTSLHPSMRLCFVRVLIHLRNKNLLSPTSLLQLFFGLLRCEDKALRKFLLQHMVADVKHLNRKTKNMKINRDIQNFMADMINDNHAVKIKMALDILIELYQRNVWNDMKTVNIIANACFSKVTKVMVAAIRFFLGNDEDGKQAEKRAKKNSSDEEDEPEEDKNVIIRRSLLSLRNQKKKKSNLRKKASIMNKIKKLDSRIKNKNNNMDFSALQLIQDPHTMADKLFKNLKKMTERFEVKIITMNLISRLIGIHELYVPNFYPFIQRYLNHKQKDVTKIMMFAAQATHRLVPPEDIEPVVRNLTDNFVTERHTGDVMSMGMNAIREICARNPFCMDQQVLDYLVEFKTHKERSVQMATKSLIQVFRQENPNLLPKKHRGPKFEDDEHSGVKEFGASQAMDYIPGAEVIALESSGNRKRSREEDEEGEVDWNSYPRDVVYYDEADPGQSKPKKRKIEDLSNLGEAIKESLSLTLDARGDLARDIVTSRVLTSEDFVKIKEAQLYKKAKFFSRNKKNLIDLEAEELNDQTPEIVPLSSIEMIHAKKKTDLETKLQCQLENKPLHKRGKPSGKANPNASTTNRVRMKAKPFMMVKHKLKGKQKLSFREKQQRLKSSLLKMQKNRIR